MAMPQFLVDAPSHYNWDIDIDTSKEFNCLILQLEEHFKCNPIAMTIQAQLFQSFLYTSKYKHPKPDYHKSREWLHKAYEETQGLANEEEKIGFMIVAKCNEAYMDHMLGLQTTTLASQIRDLMATATDVSHACIHSVRAFALSRVGMNKYQEAILYYKKALEAQPENIQWLFGLALVTGRVTRIKDGLEYSTDKELEAELYKKILKIDQNHALAHVFLAYNLVLKNDNGGAMRHAYKARELAPKHPHILAKAGKVLRKAKLFRAALPILQEACDIGRNSALYHQMGLVYRDMYIDQQKKKQEAIKKKQRWDQPEKELLKQAICWFNKALEANPTNNMAILDRAFQHERLRDFDKAEEDFLSAITTSNIDHHNRVTFNAWYGVFLVRNRNRPEKACEHFKVSIECAVQNCTSNTATRENPKPSFDQGFRKELYRATSGYKDIMEQKVRSDHAEQHSEGLKGLAWLHQVLGEHAAARNRYEEYLNCDGKSTDADVICRLVKSLIQLGDFEEARKKIQELQDLNKPDLAQSCTIECALLQGENFIQGNHIKVARELFREAVEAGSMEGCQQLADILRKDSDILSQEFRVDCAKILYCCKLNHQADHPLCDDIKVFMDLEHPFCGDLRNRHLNLEQILLENQGLQITRDILVDAAQTVYVARSMLDLIMISFRQKQYPAIQSGHCMFFHVQQDHTNQPKTEQQVKDEILKRLKTYKWEKFDTRFPDFFDFLVKLQPAYPGNTNNWYLALSQLANRDKHMEKIRYTQYHIAIILNGNKGIMPIPQGLPVYGDPTIYQGQNPGVQYDLFEVIEVARTAAIEVERIVAEFQRHM